MSGNPVDTTATEATSPAGVEPDSSARDRPQVLGTHDDKQIEEVWLQTLAGTPPDLAADGTLTFKPAAIQTRAADVAPAGDPTLTFRPIPQPDAQVAHAAPSVDDPTLAAGAPRATDTHTISSPHPERTTLRVAGESGLFEATGGAAPGGPGYHLIERIGEGGMGIVWRGFQGSLLRQVAIKQVRQAGADESFLAEAMVTAFLDHPNIVPVHSLGEDADGSLFMSMKLVDGLSWKELLHPETASHRERAADIGQVGHLRILLAVCNAIAYAHSRDVLHRDLKPANVMIGGYGEVVVMDWGIALDISEPPRDPRRTRHRDFVQHVAGTPAYMAPEMAIGRGEAQGPWTDVYLLGAILHEILTDRPPHEGRNVMATVLAASRGKPPVFGDDVPDDLAALCRDAMAREPDDRVGSVNDFQRRLEIHLTHRESIVISERAEDELAALQRADSGVDREARHAAYAKVVARFDQALELYDGNDGARTGAYEARLAYGREALASGELGLAAAQVADLPAADPATRTLAVEIEQALDARRRAARSGRHMRIALAVAATVIAVGLVTGMVVIEAERGRAAAERDSAREARSQERRERHRAEKAWAAAERSHQKARVLLAESKVGQADGLTLGGRYSDAVPLLADAAQGLRALGEKPLVSDLGLWLLLRHASPPLWIKRGHADFVRNARVSRDGRLVISGSWDRTVRLWHGPTGRLLHTLAGHTDRVRVCELSPDGALAISGSADRQARVWDTRTGQTLRTLRGHTAEVIGAIFAEDGERILTAGLDNDLILWDVASGGLLSRFHHDALLLSAELSPDGRTIYAQDSSLFRAWDVATGAILREIGYQAQRGYTPWRGFFQPGGERALVLLHGSEGVDRVELWDAVVGQHVRVLEGNVSNINAVHVDRSGRWAVTGGQGVRLWDVDSGRVAGHFVGAPREVRGVSLAPGAQHLAAGDAGGHVILWTRLPQRALRSFQLEAKLDVAEFIADGRLLLVKGAGHASRYRYHDVASGELLHTFEARLPGPRRMTVADDGRVMILARRDKKWRLEVRDWRAEQTLRELTVALPTMPGKEGGAERPDSPRGFHFIGAGDEILVAGAKGTVARYRLADGEQLVAHRPPPDLALPSAWQSIAAQDGSALCIGDTDHQLLWDVGAGRARRLDRPDVRAAALTDDGRVLALAAGVTVTIWDVARAAASPQKGPVHSLTGQRAAITQIAFLAGGGLLAVATEDRSITLWDAATGGRVRVLAEDTAAWPSPLAASRRGLVLATPGLDARLLVWDFEHARRFARLHRSVSGLLEQGDGEPDAAQRATLGDWYALRGKWDWAAEQLQAARKAGAQISELTLARALRRQGRLDNAEKALARARDKSEAPALYLELLKAAVARDRALTLPASVTPQASPAP